MTSPGDAAATAAEMVDLQPEVPPGFTQMVAAVRVEAANRDNRPIPMIWRLEWAGVILLF